ncbi:TraR/DksA family transcriptional regulator [Thermodesulfobacteriota bacterium]
MKNLKTNRNAYRKIRKLKKANFHANLFKNLYDKKEEVENMLFILMEMQKDGMNPYDSIEEFDRAEKEISANMYYSLLERKSNELKSLEKLIHRALHNNDFGYCEECGEKIGAKRLMVMPEATLCINCQREKEKPRRAFFPNGSYKKSKWQIELKDDDIDDSDILDDTILKHAITSLSLAEMDEIDIIGDQSEDDMDEDEKDSEPDTGIH